MCKQTINRIHHYQFDGRTESLFCRSDSCNGMLFPKEKRERVYLECVSCGLIDLHIPDFLLNEEYDLESDMRFLKELSALGL